MTYSIIARCPHTGRFGVGSTTFSMACGRRNESVRPNVGVSKSQAFYLRFVDPLVLEMLGQGYTPAHIMRVLEADDPDFAYRQFGIVDREGNVVAHTGSSCGPWAGHTVGPYYAAYGNGLAGPQTVAGIISGFLSQPDAPLEDRLMLALEGGRDAGGQMSNGRPRPERSAWIRVVDRLDYPEIDVRVDLHDNTVAELRRILEEFKRYQPYYRQRWTQPRSAMPEERFVASLAAATR
ncbi:DUF1028 domain-containing protein [Ramlibacter sp.]|jgi:uncharacterized Ntn-hydrolase superfamily protein|uniref:DUF1028 domain-containing protein n=1 Tax=Ramlibacter sp. TaxID=1917967 RepID=UPI002619AA8A|nr:DUF1028 domain-containing protein [Ramlibacter sp.]MDB5954044.1 hypothetical protein [Ramlibacter sp.]